MGGDISLGLGLTAPELGGVVQIIGPEVAGGGVLGVIAGPVAPLGGVGVGVGDGLGAGGEETAPEEGVGLGDIIEQFVCGGGSLGWGVASICAA